MGLGAVGLVIWACLLGPALHLGNHRNDHTHRPTPARDHDAHDLRAGLGAYAHVFEWHAHGSDTLHRHAGGASLDLGAARPAVLAELARVLAAGAAGTLDAGPPGYPGGHHDGSGSADHFAQLLLDPSACALPAIPSAVAAPSVFRLTADPPLAPWRSPQSARGPPV